MGRLRAALCVFCRAEFCAGFELFSSIGVDSLQIFALSIATKEYLEGV